MGSGAVSFIITMIHSIASHRLYGLLKMCSCYPNSSHCDI